MDVPGSGWVQRGGDCDDDDATVFPGATEACDTVDNDCDDLIDEGLPTQTYWRDEDNDGFGATGSSVQACGPVDGYATRPGDCDDFSASVNPDVTEVCNGIDDNCDLRVDDADPGLDIATGARWYADSDQDGFGDPADVLVRCFDASRVDNGEDCDDNDAARNPLAAEVCNDVDDDCDGLTDDDDVVDPKGGQTFYADTDFDGLGDPAAALVACEQPFGAVRNAEDCDDADFDVGVALAWANDLDEDGFADPTAKPTGPLCAAPGPQFAPASMATDCDDTNADANPGATERCNGFDDDCDALIDDLDTFGLPSTATLAWPDADLDTYGDAAAGDYRCEVPADWVLNGDDCNDADSAINPSGQETCGPADEDCDTLFDQDDPSLDASTLLTAWIDNDLDGFGDPNQASVSTCTIDPGLADNFGDCDDADPTFGPPEDWYEDTDGDGFGVEPAIAFETCIPPTPTAVRAQPEGFDCAPDDAETNPGAMEVCDGVDQNCDTIEECATCDAWLGIGSTVDGVYTLTIEGTDYAVYCDMTTDGGGWTLVGSATSGLEDQGWALGQRPHIAHPHQQRRRHLERISRHASIGHRPPLYVQRVHR